MKSEKSLTLSVVLVLCLVALAVYPVVWSQAPYKFPDSGALMDTANDIRDGSMDTMRDRTIGVPLLMIALGTGRVFFYYSLVGYLAVVMLLAWCMVELGISRRLVWAASLLILLPPHAQITASLMTEGTTAIMLVIGSVSLFAYLRRGGAWLLAVAAVCIGFWPYVRPTFQIAGVLIGALLWLYKNNGPRYRRAAIAVTVASVVLVGSYALHNRIKFGWGSITNGLGYSLGTRTVPVYERIADPEIREIVLRHRNRLAVTSGHVTQTWYGVRRELLDKGVDLQEIARIAQRENVRLVLQSPYAYLQMVCNAFGSYVQPFLSTMTAVFGRFQYGWALLSSVIILVFLIVQFILWGGWLLGLIGGRKEFQIPLPFEWTFTSMILFYTMLISSAIDWGEPRYRAPTDPLAIFVTAYGLTMLQSFRRSLREAPAAPSTFSSPSDAVAANS